jgi:hypothetical protein
MTERKPIWKGGYTQDGYSRQPPLHEGYIRKGGTNPPNSQVQSRPPRPAPLRPASSQGSGSTQQSPPTLSDSKK